MPSILRGVTILSPIALIYSLIPHPTTSFPIIVLKRTIGHGTLTSSPLIMDGLQTFGLAFPLASFLALLFTWAWVTKRTIVLRLINRIIWLFATPTNIALLLNHIAQQLSYIAQQLSYIAQQLSYLRLTTILRAAAATVLDADDARRPLTPRRGGLVNPVSSAFRTRSQRAQFEGGQGTHGDAGRTGNAFTSPV